MTTGVDAGSHLFCGCDGITFVSDTEHPTRPYRNEGTCNDLDF